MKTIFLSMLALACVQNIYADKIIQVEKGEYIIPDSSISHPGDAGNRMHTNIIIFKPKLGGGPVPPAGCETPASIACVYGLTPQSPGCTTANSTVLPTGGWGTIALVEAFDNSRAENDLNVFSSQFGLPACTTANGCFTVAYVGGVVPPSDDSTADEHVLDIEWAHAMAPQAKIVMVEAQSASHNDLLAAVDLASQMVAVTGGMVSYSHSAAEYPTEVADDVHFQQPGVMYFASSGDDAAPANYPSASPFVISSGGTTIVRDAQGNLLGETAWNADPLLGNGGSGGPSIYEPRPAFQNSVRKIVGGARGTPDISFDADPNSGVCTYSSTHNKGWFIDGGTSVAAPALAGIINSAGIRANSSQEKLNYIYINALKNYHSYWHDITSGNNGYPALAGYDFTTGLGSTLTYNGK